MPGHCLPWTLSALAYDADGGAWEIAFGTFGGRLPAAPIRALDREAGEPTDFKGPAFVVERCEGRRLPRPTAAVPGPPGGTEDRQVEACAVGLARTNAWRGGNLRNLPRVLHTRKATVRFPMPAAGAKRSKEDRPGLEWFFEVDPTVANAVAATRLPGDRPIEVREHLPVHTLGFALLDGRRGEPLGSAAVDDSVWPGGG